MNDQERISLILAEMERTSILRAAKSRALKDAVQKIAQARVQAAQAGESERLAEDEILQLHQELAQLELEDQRNTRVLRELQSLIALTEELTKPPEPIEDEEPIEEPIDDPEEGEGDPPEGDEGDEGEPIE